MDEIRAIENRTDENVELDQTRTPDSPNYRKQPKATIKNSVKKPILQKLFKLIIFIFITLVIGGSIGLLVFMFRSQISLFSIVGPSMEPTLKSGSSVILKHENKVAQNQMMFFYRPQGWGKESNNRTLVKRIVAVPGDNLKFNGKSFYVNDKIVYTLSPYYDCSAAPQNYEINLNNKQIFVMGDNDKNSIDSRKMFCTGKLDKMFVPKKSMIISGEVIAQF